MENKKERLYHVALFEMGLFGMNLCCDEYRNVPESEAKKICEEHKRFVPNGWVQMEEEKEIKCDAMMRLHCQTCPKFDSCSDWA